MTTAVLPAATAACPRCFGSLRPRAEFCPRCGLPTDLPGADTAMNISVNGRGYRVLERVAVGSRTTVYRCQIGGGLTSREGIFKVARDPISNGAVAREAEALRHLHAADAAGHFTPFIPAVIESFGYVSQSADSPRHANVLGYHPQVRSPANDLYSLAEVKAAHAPGLDARDMAWVWRRLLTVLGFAHSEGVAHGAVLPCHVLVDPTDHKLLLIDWSAASVPGRTPLPVPPAVPVDYRHWVDVDRYATPDADLRLAAQCMTDLVGDRDLPAALARHLSRAGHGPTAYALRLRAEFDELIESLWGPRAFRPLTMPPRRYSVM